MFQCEGRLEIHFYSCTVIQSRLAPSCLFAKPPGTRPGIAILLSGTSVSWLQDVFPFPEHPSGLHFGEPSFSSLTRCM